MVEDKVIPWTQWCDNDQSNWVRARRANGLSAQGLTSAELIAARVWACLGGWLWTRDNVSNGNADIYFYIIQDVIEINEDDLKDQWEHGYK